MSRGERLFLEEARKTGRGPALDLGGMGLNRISMEESSKSLPILYVERFQFTLDQQMTFLRFGLAGGPGPVFQVALAMQTSMAADELVLANRTGC